MAKIYANRVLAGKWAIEDVPALWRDEAAAIVAAARGAR